MATVEATYLGELRTECVHVKSGVKINTDAPVDNHGKGEAFSPTDLCAAALGTCAVTIMGLYAQNHGLDITGTKIGIEKKMSANPRRIASIEVVFTFPDKPYTDKDKKALEAAAGTCPIKLTLHPDVEQKFVFVWPSK